MRPNPGRVYSLKVFKTLREVNRCKETTFEIVTCFDLEVLHRPSNWLCGTVESAKVYCIH